MFRDIITLSDNLENREHYIKLEINNIVRIYKRHDRIIWGLRTYKIFELKRLILYNGIGINKEELGKITERYQKFLDSKGMIFNSFSQINYDYIEGDMQHFLSLPIPSIQNYIFGWQSPETIISFFRQEEKKWIESIKGNIIPKPEDKIIFSFPDKSAWWLLPRGSCSDEAKAMGHCGNVPSEIEGDRILSYRIFKNNQWYSQLTFILKEGGILGEMKGHGNQKPAEKYHDKIISLLIHGNKIGLINGITGGGYMPESNFSISDLTKQQQTFLLSKLQKPINFISEDMVIEIYNNQDNYNHLISFNKEDLENRIILLIKNNKIYIISKLNYMTEEMQLKLFGYDGEYFVYTLEYNPKIKMTKKIMLLGIENIYRVGLYKINIIYDEIKEQYPNLIKDKDILCSLCRKNGYVLEKIIADGIKPTERMMISAISSNSSSLSIVIDAGIPIEQDVFDTLFISRTPISVLESMKKKGIPLSIENLKMILSSSNGVRDLYEAGYDVTKKMILYSIEATKDKKGNFNAKYHIPKELIEKYNIDLSKY